MRQGQLRAVLGYLHRVANPDGGGPSDAQLLDRWRGQRDSAAFEVLVWRHGDMIWNVCRRLLSRPQDAEDAFQATFLTFLRKAETIDQGRFLGTWLYKVAYRTALRARAALARHTVHESLNEDFLEVAAAEEGGCDDLGPVLDEEVNRLPEKYRRPFVLCYLEGKTTDEVAQDLGCPRGTVGTRLAWARERLRARLARRGLALSAAGLATLLAEKAATASVPPFVVAITVKAATIATAGQAVAAGVISARAAALSQGVLHAMFISKLKSITLLVFVAGILGSGAGLFAHQALTDKPMPVEIAEGKPPADRAQVRVPPNQDARGWADETNQIAAEDDKDPAAGSDVNESDPLRIAGRVVQVDMDGQSLGLEVQTKGKGEMSRMVEIKMTEQTQLVFNQVGTNEAILTEGYRAVVWFEKDRKDVAARVQLWGNRNDKYTPHLEGQVVAVSAGGQGITLEKSGKGPVAAQKFAVQFTDKTRVSFANVARNGAQMAVGYNGLVFLDPDSQDTAKSVTFIGTAEEKLGASKEPRADWSGRIAGLSGDGKVLTVEMPIAKGTEPTRMEIKLTDATRESYHGVAADGANPTLGYLVQVWLAEGAQDTAARVRFFRNDPRQSVDGRILTVAADGSRLTVEKPPSIKGGEPSTQEITIAGSTRLVFSNVGPGGAKLTEGYHVRGWLVDGSENIADELVLSRSEKTNDK